MEYKALDEIRRNADVQSEPRQRKTLSKQQRLKRWAEALEREPRPYLQSLDGTEYVTRRQRYAMRKDNSPLTVAFNDPVLCAEGLGGDTYGDAIKFFALSDDELHYIVCYCHHGPTMTPKAVARRVRAARQGEQSAVVEGGYDRYLHRLLTVF